MNQIDYWLHIGNVPYNIKRTIVFYSCKALNDTYEIFILTYTIFVYTCNLNSNDRHISLARSFCPLMWDSTILPLFKLFVYYIVFFCIILVNSIVNIMLVSYYIVIITITSFYYNRIVSYCIFLYIIVFYNIFIL